jgi:hypothetical protein
VKSSKMRTSMYFTTTTLPPTEWFLGRAALDAIEVTGTNVAPAETATEGVPVPADSLRETVSTWLIVGSSPFDNSHTFR